VPLTTQGDLTFIVSKDLKGLGDNEGPALAFTYQPPSMLPVVAPWLGLLLLLALKTNRYPGAWAMLAPAAVSMLLLSFVLPAFPEVMPSEAMQVLRRCFEAVVFGFAAVGLLAPHLQHRLRFVGFLKTLFLCELATLGALVARNGFTPVPDIMALSVLVIIWVFLNLLALWLGALICRRRYRPMRLALSTGFILTVMVLGMTLPLFALTSLSSGQSPPWREFFPPLGVFAAGAGAVLLPFCFQLFVSRFLRERLQRLLHLEPAGAPPVIQLAQAPATAP
jgi:hypothetical protein